MSLFSTLSGGGNGGGLSLSSPSSSSADSHAQFAPNSVSFSDSVAGIPGYVFLAVAIIAIAYLIRKAR